MFRIVQLENQKEAQEFFGLHDENARLIEQEYDVKVSSRPDGLRISGSNKGKLERAVRAAENFMQLIRTNRGGDKRNLELIIRSLSGARKEWKASDFRLAFDLCDVAKKEKVAVPKTRGQQEYADAIQHNDIVFGIGPAGTGKTYLAMAMAVSALNSGRVRRIILTRPALEAGESLGFLPGDMHQKLSPYLRPLYDALYDMMEAEKIEKFLETGIIEVAPLAYMRGRTLNDAFIVLDEAQNCTPEQLKMFLTRLGFDSKAVITGDITQSDLPGGKPMGLVQALELLADIQGIKISYLTGEDVVRHELVQRVIEAYEKAQRHNA
ncbi:MAG: PhoH family protein [Candidatus Omnitrophica bacterium]|nr:PhoH family protein [Candidatus Omnitrophota bacterium]MDD5574912.1 PhoH family protein [Candidatus Omnitrophota bacterium]